MLPRFLGPVCYYDMVRSARRGRYFLLRCLYALGLASLLILLYSDRFGVFVTNVRPTALAAFGENYFSCFMLIQYGLALLLTPAYVAGAISEEKERKTLEFLLATDLQGQEIVFSKLVSRLMNLLLFLLAGMPVLSLITLFGGINPELLWCGFAATGLSILSAGCLSILVSVYVWKARDAIVRTTMLIFGYELFCLLLLWLFMVVQGQQVMAKTAAGRELTLDETVLAYGFEGLTSGSFILALVRLYGGADFTSLGLPRSPRFLLIQFALFHGSLAILFLAWACLRVRPVFVRQTYGAPRRLKNSLVFRRRPPVSTQPVLWKERFIESAARLTRGAVVFYILAFLFAMLPLFLIGWYGLTGAFDSGRELEAVMNAYVRIAGTIVALLLLLGVGVRAASAVAGERDKQTLDSLLASPLTLREILRGKWLGAVLGSNYLFALLCFIWALGLVTLGLNPVMVPLLLAALACYAALMASLGTFFSVSARNTNRAILWTVGTALFLGGGHWLCCGVGTMMLMRNEYAGLFLAGLTPPWVLGSFAMSYHENELWRSEMGAAWFMFNLLGVLVAGVGAMLLWSGACKRFEITSGRAEHSHQAVRATPSPRRRVESPQ